MKTFSVREMTYAAVGVVLITVCSWISVPLTIPVTLQTFAVCLVTALLGLKTGLCSVVCFILLGAAGIPVFSGFRGGIGVLLGITGGYIIGFILTALTVGLAVKKPGHGLSVLIPAMAVGILLCYAFGTAWFIIVYTRTDGPVSLGAALGWCVVPYLIPDGVKILLAALLARRLAPLIPKA